MLVGPSGSGKSTVLRVIAGLDRHVGRILIDDKTSPISRHNSATCDGISKLRALSAPDRPENCPSAFACVEHRPPKFHKRVSDVAALLGIEGLLQRRPSQLSGGQRQRVALGGRSFDNRRPSCSTSRCRTSIRRYVWTHAPSSHPVSSAERDDGLRDA